jgi:hypothetical protein
VEVGTPDEIRNSRNQVVRGFVEGKPELVEGAGKGTGAAAPARRNA